MRILELFQDKQSTTIMQELSNFMGVEVSLLPSFNIQRNMSINRLISSSSGWHPDCGGETSYPYCRARLTRQDYVFGKVGFYLQENTDFGGSIDVIPKSHRKIRSCNKLKTFLPKALLWCVNNIFWRISQTINRSFPKINCGFPETAVMLILGAKTIKASPSSPVFFDSGLWHRSTPIAQSKEGQVKFVDDVHFELPNGFTKYGIYCHYGSSIPIESHMYDRMRRKGQQDSLEKWIKEIEIIKSIYPSLAVSIRRVLDPANV